MTSDEQCLMSQESVFWCSHGNVLENCYCKHAFLKCYPAGRERNLGISKPECRVRIGVCMCSHTTDTSCLTAAHVDAKQCIGSDGEGQLIEVCIHVPVASFGPHVVQQMLGS